MKFEQVLHEPGPLRDCPSWRRVPGNARKTPAVRVYRGPAIVSECGSGEVGMQPLGVSTNTQVAAPRTRLRELRTGIGKRAPIRL